MPLHIVAPCPKKPSSLSLYWNADQGSMLQDDVDEACQELQEILASQTRHALVRPSRHDEHLIARTNNPLPHDASFVPLHQAVSNLHVSDTRAKHRPRSFSVGDSRNHQTHYKVVSLVH
ncbi:hypothetical protein DFQ30_002977 [Apophysomyces sp. BC1015]|nr:hypothetical protein DFQ30_002977 [Apophysomyces sp. BC1015]